MVREVRTGPPLLSVFSLPGADGLGNFIEYFVHHEDVRRAQPEWHPRALAPDESDELWSRLGQLAKLMYRRVPVGVTLRRTDGPGGQIVARRGEPMVALTGTASELLLRTYGRTAVDVDVTGPPEAVTALASARLGI